MSKKPKIVVDQVFYNDRYVDRATFRAFVYNFEGEKLANSYDEYEELISSGLWFSDKCKVLKPRAKPGPKPKLIQIPDIEHESRQVNSNDGNS